jgi:hypothetical protein
VRLRDADAGPETFDAIVSDAARRTHVSGR